MKKQQWLRIIPIFLCIFTLMAFFLNYGYVRFALVTDAGTEQVSKAYTGWQAILTTLYGWLLVAIPVVILLAKLVPEAAKVEPVASLMLPGLHVVLMFLLLNGLPNAVKDFDHVMNPSAAVGIGFLLMLACQIAMAVLRLMELVTTPPVPAQKPADPGLVPTENDRYPAQKR